MFVSHAYLTNVLRVERAASNLNITVPYAISSESYFALFSNGFRSKDGLRCRHV